MARVALSVLRAVDPSRVWFVPADAIASDLIVVCWSPAIAASASRAAFIASVRAHALRLLVSPERAS